MDPRSEVLLRQAELFKGPLLLAGLPADDLLGQLPEAHGWSWHAGEQSLLETRFAGRCHFGTQPGERDFQAAVLFLPKSRELTDYLLQALAAEGVAVCGGFEECCLGGAGWQVHRSARSVRFSEAA